MTFSNEEKVETFKRFRPRLFGLAYRMLGTHAETEDILQDAYLRWHQADAGQIDTPEARLVTVVTRLAIDRLRKASREHETYIGPWLPEPLLVSAEISPQEAAEMNSSLSLAFLFLLERLSPLERAVFLLHDIFDCGYADIARIVGKSEAAAWQMIHRARERLRTDRTRFPAGDGDRAELIRKFAAASCAGDEKTILSLFSDEISMVSDGGKVSAARKIVRGKHRLARLFSLTGAKHGPFYREMIFPINGEIGLLTFFEGKIFAATVFEMDGDQVSAIYRVMNPDKLKAFAEQDESSIAGGLII
jgi:RNA polymerase sigma-70 factor (ECF subfamily)